MEPLPLRLPRAAEVAKGSLDSAADVQLNQSVCFAEDFLRCCHQIEVLQKSLAGLDGSLMDEPLIPTF